MASLEPPIFFLLLGLVAAARSQDVVSCATQLSTCACETEGGKFIDLTPLDSHDPQKPKFDGIMDYMNDAYSYNPCSNFSANGCSGVAVCQSRDSIGYNLGTQQAAKFGNDPYTNDLQITYTATGDDGVARTAIVTLKCDVSQEGSMTAEGEYPTGTYDLTLTSKYACPVDKPYTDTTTVTTTVTASDVTTVTPTPTPSPTSGPWVPAPPRIVVWGMAGTLVIVLLVLSCLATYTCVKFQCQGRRIADLERWIQKYELDQVNLLAEQNQMIHKDSHA